MKFNSPLTEGILLKRILGFMAEIALTNKQRLMIRCPNLSAMKGCDTLGSKIWYSNPIGYHCLPTWELVEVDNGHLVCVDKELMRPLFKEAVKKGTIRELVNYESITLSYQEQMHFEIQFLQHEEANCYVGLEQVLAGDSKGMGYFPSAIGDSLDLIKQLIHLKQEGYRTILFLCVMHSHVNRVQLIQKIDPIYKRYLTQAIDGGVEVIAYRASITLEGLEITSPLPVLFSEDITTSD